VAGRLRVRSLGRCENCVEAIGSEPLQLVGNVGVEVRGDRVVAVIHHLTDHHRGNTRDQQQPGEVMPKAMEGMALKAGSLANTCKIQIHPAGFYDRANVIGGWSPSQGRDRGFESRTGHLNLDLKATQIGWLSSSVSSGGSNPGETQQNTSH
jgi:hypothetical protein